MRSSVKRNVRRNGPRRNGGGVRKMEQGCSKKSLAWRRSEASEGFLKASPLEWLMGCA